MNDPTREELEEVAACGILLAKTFLDSNFGNAGVFAATLLALTDGLFEGPIPAWMKAARPRVEAKLDAFKKGKKSDGKAPSA